MSVREAQARIDAAEFSEWMAFEQIDPSGEWRADLRSGMIAATVAVAHGAKDVSPSDFMMFVEKMPEKKQTEAQQIEAAKQIAVALGVVAKSKS